MLFLLPPSETKASGGGGLTIDQVALSFGGLNKARDAVRAAANLESVLSAPTMPAVDRYTGTLYSAIHGRGLKGTETQFNQLTSQERSRAKESVLVQSALFGLIPVTDLIPEYKLNPTKLVSGLSLKKTWAEAHLSIWPRLNGLIIDLRSKSYAELAPIPDEIEHCTVSVFVEREDGVREQLNHFNKKAKGQLVRAALSASQAPKTIKDLQNCAAEAGLKLEVRGLQLILVTTSAT
jgi:cytoplasmic iron level regulating protein YaaA (DUF328/UPF0246 family)